MKGFLALIVVLGWLCPTAALAEKGDFWVGLQGGGSIPTGEFAEGTSLGLTGGVTATYMASDEAGVGVDLAYKSWRSDLAVDRFTTYLFGSGAAANFRALEATLHVRRELRRVGNVTPYAKAGAGIYWGKTRFEPGAGGLFSAFQSDASVYFTYKVGLGIDDDVSAGFRIGVGATYYIVEAYPDVHHVEVALRLTRMDSD